MCNYNRPNFSIHTEDCRYNYIGDNNLRREFFDCFSTILYSCYGEDSDSGRYYNHYESDGTSSYYVRQPDIERELDKFVKPPTDDGKYLIGFTGIGKTTLIKNYFKIRRGAPLLNDNGALIAYLSVFSYKIEDTKGLSRIFVSFLQTITAELRKKVKFNPQNQQDQNDFYEYCRINRINDVIEDINFGSHPESKNQCLKRFKKSSAITFYSMLISFLIEKAHATQNMEISKVILIYDDIESQKSDLHIPFIENAELVAAVLRDITKRNYVVKSLIAMRNYTFRYHYSRNSDARRDYAEDVILKTTIPPLREIFKKRFQMYDHNSDIKEIIPSKQRWISSTKVLEKVVENIADFGNIISSISNYDIAHSIKLFLRILTNHKWFAPNESYYEGAYSLNPTDYLPVKERVFKALAYGEGTVFMDCEDNLLPNILRYHSEEDEPDIGLISLYVMEFMLSKQRATAVRLYGDNGCSIKGKDIVNSITNILRLPDDRKELVSKSVERLYMQRCLLQSIFQVENPNTDADTTHDRSYHSSYKLYVSLRGNIIMDLLQNDSLLLEFFRDDIDTDIRQNTVPSAELSQREKTLYLIRYCSSIFQQEQEYICHANKIEYFRNFGNSFVSFRLFRGIYNSFNYFFKRIDDDSNMVKSNLKFLFDQMSAYKEKLLKDEPKLIIKLEGNSGEPINLS